LCLENKLCGKKAINKNLTTFLPHSGIKLKGGLQMKTKIFIAVIALIALMAGSVLAAQVPKDTKMIYSTGYSYGYEFQLPSTITGLPVRAEEGEWLCGDTNVPINYRSTSYYYKKQVAGITKWNLLQVVVMNDNGDGFDKEINLNENSVSIDMAYQFCAQEYDYTCYAEGCKCENISEIKCSEVVTNDALAGQTVRIRIPVDLRVK
jgi:hypothetical protein